MFQNEAEVGLSFFVLVGVYCLDIKSPYISDIYII